MLGKSGLLTLSALLLVGATQTGAQETADDASRPALRRGVDVESIMSMRERLALTEDQLAALDAIRRETVQLRTAEMAEGAEMRSRLRAGLIRPSEMMAFMEDRRDANAGVAEERRERIEAVLDEAQLESLREIRTGGRAFMRERAGMRGGRGRALGPSRGRGVPGRGLRSGRRPGDGPERGFRGARGGRGR
jgi:hypothetical protein